MSETSAARVSVRILEKEYFIACSHNERTELLDSAELLNTRMREIRDSGKVVGLDRVAVMAALNIAHELLKLRNRDDSLATDVSARLRSLRERADAALDKDKGQQLEL